MMLIYHPNRIEGWINQAECLCELHGTEKAAEALLVSSFTLYGFSLVLGTPSRLMSHSILMYSLSFDTLAFLLDKIHHDLCSLFSFLKTEPNFPPAGAMLTHSRPREDKFILPAL